MHPYPYIMDSVKAVQAMAYLLKQAGGVHSYTEILKMLYRADIRSFKETALPLVRSGGELAELLPPRYIPDTGEWQEHLSVNNIPSQEETLLVLKDNPGKGKLSPYEIELLEDIYEEVSNE